MVELEDLASLMLCKINTDRGRTHATAVMTAATRSNDSPASVVCNCEPSLCSVALGLGATIGFDAEPEGIGIVVRAIDNDEEAVSFTLVIFWRRTWGETAKLGYEDSTNVDEMLLAVTVAVSVVAVFAESLLAELENEGEGIPDEVL